MQIVLYEDRVRSGVPDRRMGGVSAIVLLLPFLVLTLALVHSIAPQRSGFLAITQVFAPYLYLPLLLLLPFALLRGALLLRIVLIACAVVFVVRYMPQTHNAPAAIAGERTFTAVTWNSYMGNSQHNQTREMLLTGDVDIVALQESSWDSIEEDTAIRAAFPYRLTDAGEMPPGMFLLSKHAIVDYEVVDGPRYLWDIPRAVWVRLDLGDGKLLTIVNAHPIAPYTFGRGCALPVCFNPSLRDRQLEAIGELVDELLSRGDAVLLLGDLNVTEREPAYLELTSRLVDAQVAAGSGVGNTWRPGNLLSKDLAILRIDYLFASSQVVPLSVETDCASPNSDHCLLRGRFAIR